jgi:hypothetical protein
MNNIICGVESGRVITRAHMQSRKLAKTIPGTSTCTTVLVLVLRAAVKSTQFDKLSFYYISKCRQIFYRSLLVAHQY